MRAYGTFVITLARARARDRFIVVHKIHSCVEFLFSYAKRKIFVFTSAPKKGYLSAFVASQSEKNRQISARRISAFLNARMRPDRLCARIYLTKRRRTQSKYPPSRGKRIRALARSRYSDNPITFRRGANGAIVRGPKGERNPFTQRRPEVG